jgi:hypothetical protein
MEAQSVACSKNQAQNIRETALLNDGAAEDHQPRNHRGGVCVCRRGPVGEWVPVRGEWQGEVEEEGGGPISKQIQVQERTNYGDGSQREPKPRLTVLAIAVYLYGMWLPSSVSKNTRRKKPAQRRWEIVLATCSMLVSCFPPPSTLKMEET